MANLSHLVIIEDVIEKHLLLYDTILFYGENNIPLSIIHGIEDLDRSMQQFGKYDGIREQLIDEGAII